MRGTRRTCSARRRGELIALAVAVTRQCDGCITIHTNVALKEGATRDEIVEALAVAIAVNAGPALVYSTRVLGLPNRGALSEHIREELQRAARYRTPVSLLLIDVDGLKQVND